LYFSRKRQLQFKFLAFKLERPIFEKVVMDAAAQLSWTRVAKGAHFVFFKSGLELTTWRQQITIIRSENQVLFRSINDLVKN
jgi:hypothetical protein